MSQITDPSPPPPKKEEEEEEKIENVGRIQVQKVSMVGYTEGGDMLEVKVVSMAWA